MIFPIHQGDLRCIAASLPVFLPKPVDGIANALRGNAVTGAEMSILLHFRQRILDVSACQNNLADSRWRAGHNLQSNIYLLCGRIRLLGISRRGVIETVIFHEHANAFQAMRNLVQRKLFSQLEFSCVGNLARCRTIRSSDHVNRTDEKIGLESKSEPHPAIGSTLHLGSHIRIASGVVKILDGLSNLAAIERFALRLGNLAPNFTLRVGEHPCEPYLADRQTLVAKNIARGLCACGRSCRRSSSHRHRLRRGDRLPPRHDCGQRQQTCRQAPKQPRSQITLLQSSVPEVE